MRAPAFRWPRIPRIGTSPVSIRRSSGSTRRIPTTGSIACPRKTYSAWFSDTWAVNSQLTLNLGIRYDLPSGDFTPPGVTDSDLVINNGLFTENVGYRNNLRDTNNFGPRVGFAWNVGGKGDLVIRGGSGIFYSGVGGNPAFDVQMGAKVITNSYANDGKPGFVTDPTRGVTAAQILSGQVPLAPQSLTMFSRTIETPRSWQSSLGFQKQIGPVMGLESNLVYLRGYNEENNRDPNLFYNSANGWPKNPVTSGRPRPDFGPLRIIATDGWSESLKLPTTFTRRYRDNFQFTVAYTLTFFKNDAGIGGSGYGNNLLNPFDIAYNWGRSNDFSRHSLRTNGVLNLPHGVNLSGSFQYATGEYATFSSGLSPLGGNGATRLRADLSFIPKNTFQNDSSQSLDVRLTKDINLGHGVKVTGMVEGFNLLGHTMTTYDLRENAATFMQVSNMTGIRTGQLAFRIGF